MTDFGNVALVTRIGGVPHPKFFDAWTHLVRLGLRPNDMVMNALIRMPAHRAGNRAVDAFLSEPALQDCDTLCFVDDDHVFGYDTLERMRERGQAYDVFGALYAARGPQGKNFPVCLRRAYTEDGEPGVGDDGHPRYKVPSHLVRGEIFECDALGLGFTMIRRPILAAVMQQYGSCFEYREPTTTEDVVFCERAAECGAMLAVDAGTIIGHLMDLMVTPQVSEPQTDDEAGE